MIDVRDARPDDAALIHGFILALAEYERMAEGVRTTEADVARTLFGPSPRAFCDIAEENGAPVGFALWFYNFSTFEGRHGIYLEDLFVNPEWRGKGAGLALLRRLARRCADEGLPRLEWAVLDWNELAINFYDRLGAEAKTQWITRRLSGEALAKLGGS